jgi:transcriptional regulator with XRE-family HTH domain
MNEQSDAPFAALASRVRALRDDRGLSQQALAEEANVSYRTLQYLESGQRAPQRSTLIQLADALGVTYEDLRLLAGRSSISDALTDRELDALAEKLVTRLEPLLSDLLAR